MTFLIVCIAIYLLGCVLAYGVNNYRTGFDGPTWLVVLTTSLSWTVVFACWALAILSDDPDFIGFRFRNPDKREAKRLRQEEIQRRIEANTFDFNTRPIPQMYAWMDNVPYRRGKVERRI